MSQTPRLYLIDAYANIFRAFYAIRNLSNTRGEPTNAVFGFLQILRKLLRDEDPQYLGVAFDVSSDTVRKERFEDYKANRKPMPEDLKPQIPWIRRVIDAYKIPMLEMPGYEADDVLGTLAKKATAAGFEVVLVSADKDLMQLVGNGVFLYHTGRDKLYDAAMVEEDFGVPPEKVIDVLALMGDASDNIPGVKGIGEKGAKSLITEYGSLQALLDNPDGVKRKSYREGLQNHREDALMSLELVTIHTDLPVDFNPDALRREEPDTKTLLEICWELDFANLAKEIEQKHGVEAEEIAPAVRVDADGWRAAIADLPASEGPPREIHLGAVGDFAGAAVAVGLAGRTAKGVVYIDFSRDEDRAAARDTLRAWLADPEIALIGHDLKEILRIAQPANSAADKQTEAPPRCRLLDTMLISYVIAPALRGHTLADISLERLRRSAVTPQEAGFTKGKIPPPEDPALLAFAAEQAELPRRMIQAMRDELKAEGMEKVYAEIEEPLVPVLTCMEEAGIVLDTDFLAAMSSELGEEADELEERIYVKAGERFNLGSPVQLGEVLFEHLGYPVQRRTKKSKNYSTDAETLEKLAAQGFDVPGLILRYRELTKLKSTYIDAFPSLVAADGRLHTRFNQAVAATGRLSSAHPNLQNIPVRTELGQRIRKAFRAAENCHLVVADYSQIELRVLAHIAQEEAMIEAFRKGEDIHAATAAAVFGGSPLLINPEQRRMAKTINFGIIYGMSAWGLASRLQIPKADAQHFIDAYMERYAGVRRYTEETLAMAETHRKVETLYGRVRWLPDITSRNWNIRENARRMAINARIQGTAADILKLAMIAVDRRVREDLPAARLLLTVHDELVLEAPREKAEEVGEMVRKEMEGIAQLDVPLVVDVGSDETWYAAKG